jgi:hypothetical protein
MLFRPSTNICPKDLTRDMRGFFNSLQMLLMTRADLSKHLLAFGARKQPATYRWTEASFEAGRVFLSAYGTADKSHTKTWWRRLDSSLSHVTKLCERLPVSEYRPRLAPINFQASGTLPNARRITLTRIQQFRVTFLTLSRAINRSNGDRLQIGQAAVATRRIR